MNDGFNLMLETANYYKKEMLAEQMLEHAKEYSLVPNKDNYEKMLGVSQLMMAKELIESMGIEKVRKLKREKEFSDNLFMHNMN